MIESLLKALEKINNISIDRYRDHKSWFSQVEQSLQLFLLAYDKNLAELTSFGETKLNTADDAGNGFPALNPIFRRHL
ncbi:hypothetical protein ACLD72_024960 [Paenibacillus sp. TH7-28]